MSSGVMFLSHSGRLLCALLVPCKKTKKTVRETTGLLLRNPVAAFGDDLSLYVESQPPEGGFRFASATTPACSAKRKHRHGQLEALCVGAIVGRILWQGPIVGKAGPHGAGLRVGAQVFVDVGFADRVGAMAEGTVEPGE